MTRADARCVLLADSHHGLSEGLRTMLATTFETVVMVADQGSLFETARRLHSDLAVVDLALPREIRWKAVWTWFASFVTGFRG